jgi:hypothetical protein
MKYSCFKKKWIALLGSAGLVPAADALQIEANIEIPRLNVVEYHRPYFAVWIEDANRRVVQDLLVSYDLSLPDSQGETWLKDLRQWWRKSGRSAALPIAGVSAPTKPPGMHSMVFSSTEKDPLVLSQGSYFFVVEAAREVGGRELITIPFDWQDGKDRQTFSAQGERELGKIVLTIQSK